MESREAELIDAVADLAKAVGDAGAGRRFWENARRILDIVPPDHREKVHDLLAEGSAEWVDEVVTAAVTITHDIDRIVYRGKGRLCHHDFPVADPDEPLT